MSDGITIPVNVDGNAVSALKAAAEQLRMAEAAAKALQEATGLDEKAFKAASAAMAAAAKEAQAAERERTAAAKEAAAAQVAAAREAERAAKERAEAVKKAAEEERKAAEEQKSALQRAEQSWTSLNAKIGVVTTGINAAIAVLRGAAEWMAEGAARTERHAVALSTLGPAYQMVQNATLGAVSAEQALAAQQRITHSGLRVGNTQLATITRAAREYARATGTETTQALEQLTDALVGGEAEGLRRFGISLRQGEEGARAFRSAIRQLEAQQREADPATRSMAEVQEQLARNFGLVKDALGAQAAEWSGFNRLLRDANDLMEQLASGALRVSDVLPDMLGDILGLRGESGMAQRQRQQNEERERFAREYNQILSDARRSGVSIGGAPGVLQIERLSAERRREALEIMRGWGAGQRVERDAATGRGLMSDVMRTSAVFGDAGGADTAAQAALQRRLAGAQARNATADIARINALIAAQSTEGAGRNTRRTQQGDVNLEMLGPDERQALKALQLETGYTLGHLAQRYGTLNEAVRIYRANQEANLQLQQALNERLKQHNPVLEEHRDRWLRYNEAVVRTRNNLVSAQRAAADAELARRSGRAQAAEEVGVGALGREVFGFAAEGRGSAWDRERAEMQNRIKSIKSFAATAKEAWDGIGGAIADNLTKLAAGEQGFAESIKNIGLESLKMLGELALKKGVFYTLEGIASLLFAPAAAANYFIAGAGMLALGAGLTMGAAGVGAYDKPAASSASAGGGSSDAGSMARVGGGASASGGGGPINVTIVYGAGVLSTPRDLAQHVASTLNAGAVLGGVRLDRRLLRGVS